MLIWSLPPGFVHGLEQMSKEGLYSEIEGLRLKNEQLQRQVDLLALKQVTINDAAREFAVAAMDLLYGDSHQWSSRPCSTCRAISGLLKLDFGCTRYAKERGK